MIKQRLFLLLLTVLIAIVSKAQCCQWNVVGNGVPNFDVGATSCMAIDLTGKIYVAGTIVNQNKKKYVAIWDGSKWDEVGGVGTSKFNSSFSCITTDKNGSLYAGGLFKNANGNYYVAVIGSNWNEIGGSNWSELGGDNTSNLNGQISCLTTDKNGNLYAGGYFTNASGNYYIAKWNGNSWEELGGLNTSTFNGPIHSIIIDKSGNLYTGGEFTNPSLYRYIAVYNGKSWSELGGANTKVFATNIKCIALDVNGNIYAAGVFNYVEKWDGSIWSELGGKNKSTFNNNILCITTDSSSNVYAVGNFTSSINNKPYVAKFDGSIWSELGYPGAVGYATSTKIPYVITYHNNIYTTTTSASMFNFVEGYSQTGLPLTLENIIASIENRNISIDWYTSTELSTSHFSIQYSTDGSSFSDIGIVKAIGSGANGYQFTYYSPTNGTNYYRIKSVDKDGSFTYSKVVSVNYSDKQSFSIFPNPAKDFARINFSKTLENATIEVYDISGKPVIKEMLKGSLNSYHLNTQKLKNGVYIIKINSSTGSYNEKLLINK